MLTRNYVKLFRKIWDYQMLPMEGNKNLEKNKNSNQIWGINNNIKFVKDTVKKGKGIQCGECEWYGHIQAKCVYNLKK